MGTDEQSRAVSTAMQAAKISDRVDADLHAEVVHPRRDGVVSIAHRRRKESAGDLARNFGESGDDAGAFQSSGGEAGAIAAHRRAKPSSGGCRAASRWWRERLVSAPRTRAFGCEDRLRCSTDR